jgi:hypothetical protein
MKGPKYIEKHPHKLKVIEETRIKHLKTLEEIKAKKSQRIDCSTPDCFRIRHSKQSPADYYKNQEIYRENQSLLGKLLELTESAKRYAKASVLNQNYLFHKSLNKNKRKFEQDKIVSENRGLANRIASVSPSLSRKFLEKDFTFHVRYKANISKFDDPIPLPKKIRPGSLSPLNSKKELVNDSSVGETKNPYIIETNHSVIRKEWKIAPISPSPSSSYLMAIPMAMSPDLLEKKFT